MAFGAALAGTIGNVAGLQEVATADTVRAAVPWVYFFNVLPLTLAAPPSRRDFFRSSETQIEWFHLLCPLRTAFASKVIS